MIPALFAPDTDVPPLAFFAVTGICTVGLYIAYIIAGVPAAAGGRLVRDAAVDPRAERTGGSTSIAMVFVVVMVIIL